MAYSDPTEYAKYLKKKCEDEGCGGDCNGCNETNEDCGCCPPGLVDVQDKDGVNVGCLTPLDAQEYMKNTYRCPDGYVRVFEAVSGMFVGCLTPDEYAAYVAVVP